MTIESQINKATSEGDDTTVQFFYTFRVDNDSDMHPYLDEIEQTSGFVVNRNPDNIGGDVTFDVPPAVGVTVTLLRDVPLSQTTDYTAYDAFPAESHELALDKLTMQTQQIEEEVSRATKAPITDDGTTDYTLPAYDPGKGITWDETEKKMVNSDVKINEITTEAQTSADASAASAVESAGYATNSSSSADASQLKAWDAEAEEMTANSYAVEPEDTFVKIYTSDGDGTFTATPTTDYSALHYAAKAGGIPEAPVDGSINARKDTAWLDIKPQIATAWALIDGISDVFIGTPFNMGTIISDSAGHYSVTFDIPMENTDYIIMVTPSSSNAVVTAVSDSTGKTVNGFSFYSFNSAGTPTDCSSVGVQTFGGKN